MSIAISKTHPASAASVAALENQLGKRLPEGYLKFLSEYDGAKPEDNAFKVGQGNSAGVDQFIPANDVLRVRESVEGFPSDALPIARATAGNFVYMDVTGAIYFWDHEDDSGDTKLAASFQEFIDMLERFDLSQVKLKPGQVKKVWVNPNFKPKF